MSIRLLIAEPQEMVRVGLKHILEDSEVRIVAFAATAAQTIESAKKHRPDLIMIELRFEDMDGLQLVGRMKLELPEQRILIFSAYDNARYIARAAALGVEGYLDKRCTREELLRAIRNTASGGQNWLRYDLRRISVAMSSPPGVETLEASLSQREWEVLKKMIDGATNDDIARDMRVSYETIKEQVQSLLRKIGVEDRTQAAVWAVRNKLI